MDRAEARIARQTADLLLAHLPEGARVLDVGCGPGAVAAHLAEAGRTVVGLDVDPEAVDAARRRGVDARLETLPEHAGGDYDAIVFAYSLHHVRSLEATAEAAWQRLRPGGRLIVLEMAFDDLDERTRRWARIVESLLVHAGAIEGPGCAFFAHGEHEAAGGRGHAHLPGEPAHPEETHDFHGSREILEVLGRRFELVEAQTGPILHVFFGRALGDRVAVLEDVRALEEHGVAGGAIRPIGRIYVLKRSPVAADGT